MLSFGRLILEKISNFLKHWPEWLSAGPRRYHVISDPYGVNPRGFTARCFAFLNKNFGPYYYLISVQLFRFPICFSRNYFFNSIDFHEHDERLIHCADFLCVLTASLLIFYDSPEPPSNGASHLRVESPTDPMHIDSADAAKYADQGDYMIVDSMSFSEEIQYWSSQNSSSGLWMNKSF